MEMLAPLTADTGAIPARIFWEVFGEFFLRSRNQRPCATNVRLL